MTSTEDEKEFPDWDSYYKESDVEKMPWYEVNLDLDIKEEIELKELKEGKFLDLGTGPGTQAAQLAKFGFNVTGSDLSQSAVGRAKKLYPSPTYVTDDILNSKFPDDEFDFILDRGVFHVFEPEQRPRTATTDDVGLAARICNRSSTVTLSRLSTPVNDVSNTVGEWRRACV